MKAVLHREGVKGLYHGVTAVALGAGYVVFYGMYVVVVVKACFNLRMRTNNMIIYNCRPSHALYFASYEAAKQFYGGNAPGHQPLATAAAGEMN